MLNSIVSICNLAISRIASSNFISSIDEASTEAVVCRAAYYQCVDRLLAEFNWPFARTYQTLNLVTTTGSEAWADDWSYAYRYPSDVIAVRRIVTSLGQRESTPAPYIIARDTSGRIILTDVTDAIIEYTARISDPVQFDPAFGSALAWFLALEISAPLSAMDGLRKQAAQMYAAELDAAKRIAVSEEELVKDIDTEFINSRSGPTAFGSNPLNIFPSGFKVS